jgi:hypothetical protein
MTEKTPTKIERHAALLVPYHAPRCRAHLHGRQVALTGGSATGLSVTNAQ